MPIIVVTHKAEIRRISVGSQPGLIVCKTLSRKSPSQKRTGGMAQGVGPEFKQKKKCFQHNIMMHVGAGAIAQW
jgi:hypothetical protein